MFIKIPLAPHFERFALIDQEDHWHAQFTWRVRDDFGKGKNRTYVYRYVNGGKTKIYLHRAIMDPPNDLIVDHINSDGLDNRRHNLRITTHKENYGNINLRQIHFEFMNGNPNYVPF